MLGRNKGSSVMTEQQHTQERRLRPAYDFLDRGNHKRVIQEADRLLKKQPDFQCAKALKALALLRMGNVQDCRLIIDALVNETPTEENTIQVLTISFRELGLPRMVCTILENASKVDKSEDMLTSCFMANVRVSDFQKQYQIALNLYKLYPKPPYFAWAVMSLFVKAEFDPDPMSSRISLPLAEKMMSKFFEEKNHKETEHEVSLYILLLHRLGNHKKILSIIDRLISYETPLLTGFYYRLKAECLKMTEDSKTTAEYLEETILKNLGEWSYYETYIKHVGLTDTKGTLEFLDSLDKFLPGSPLISRTILLAPLYLYNHLIKNYCSEPFDPIRHLRKYLFYYGRLPSFFADIEPFFASLTQDELKHKIVQIVREDVAEDREEFKLYAMLQPQQANDRQGKVNCCYTQRYLEPLNENNAANTLIESCILEYLNAIKEELRDGNWPQKDVPQDYFINCAALSLIDMFWSPDSEWSWSPASVPEDDKGEHGGINGMSRLQLEKNPNDRDVGPLLAMCLLHYCLDKSPTNSQSRLLLGKLFLRCGAGEGGMSTMGPLDLKHMMLVSTSYLYTSKLIPYANYEEAFRAFNSIETFFSTFEKEGMEHVLSAYKYGSWEKILEFLKFRDHLLKSLLRPLVKVEKMLLEYATEGCTAYFYSTDPNLIKAGRKSEYESDLLGNLDELTDSRDFDLIDTFKCRLKTEEWKKISFEGEKKHLRIRSLLLSFLNTSNQIGELIKIQEPYEEQLNKLEGIMNILDTQLQGDVSQFIIRDATIDAMWPPTISNYVQGPCLRYLIDLFRLTVEVGRNGSQLNLSQIRTKLSQCLDAVLNNPTIINFEQTASILEVGNILETISELVETLSFSCILLELISLMTKSVPGIARKSKKKRSKPPVEVETVVGESELAEVMNGTSEGLKRIEKIIEGFNESLNRKYSNTWKDLEGFWKGKVPAPSLLHEHLLPSTLPIIINKLRSSYLSSTTALSYLIQFKINYLTKLSKGFDSVAETS